MKLLVIGKNGQVASELQRQFDVIALGREQADLTDPEACAQIILASNADAIINAAAFTAVDLAEAQEATANLINGEAPAAMARAAAQRNIPFLHISTDYVFDGSGSQSRRPTDLPNPINAYGRSKLLGERGIIEAGGKYAILRTSWVFSAVGHNFVKSVLRLARTQSALSIVDDQTGGPTPAAGIAGTLLKMAKTYTDGAAPSGVYHYSGAPVVSWKTFAEEIIKQSGLGVPVNGIPSSSFPTPAKRPLNSRLDGTNLQQVFGAGSPDWRAGLQAVLSELGEAK